MNTHPSSVILKHQLKQQHGFNLVELMVSMTLGLLLLYGIMTLYTNMNNNNRELVKTGTMIENGRFAIQILEKDIVHAGFWGGHVPEYDDLTETGTPSDVPTAIPDPCKAYSEWDATADADYETYRTNLIGIPIQVYEDANQVGTCDSSPSIFPDKQASTDILVVRHANTCVPGATNCEALNTGKMYFQFTRCTDSTDTRTINLHTDPENTNTGDAIPDRLHQFNCTTNADIRKFISHIYYIRDYAVTTGDGIPTLMRSEFDLSGGTLAHQSAVPLIEGIEGFRIELGIDSLSKTGAAIDYSSAIAWQDSTDKETPTNRGDGTADGAYVHCTTSTPCTTAQFMNTVTARIFILARALEASQGHTDSKTYTLGSTTLGPFNDNFKRHVFTSTVRLFNISGRRETP